MNYTRTVFTIESVAGTRYPVYRRSHAADPGESGSAPPAAAIPNRAALTTYGGRTVRAYADATFRVDGSGEIFRRTADA